MLDEGFLRTSRDDCIYVHPTSTVTCSLYVDDILAAADPHYKAQLLKFIKRVQRCFLVRVLGEPTKFLGMEISYLRQQGVCCISQRTYIEKRAFTFLNEHTSSLFPSFPTTPREANVYDKLQLASSEPRFEGPYRSLVGGLLYLFVCTHMDIGSSLSILTQQ